MEIITFGDFIQLYSFCYKRLHKKIDYKELLWSTKIIRNATAHNNCLLNNLSSKMSTQTSNMVRSDLKNDDKNATYYHRHKNCYVIMDIISVCYFYNLIINNQDEKMSTFNQIQEKVINRIFQNAYFSKNTVIRECFELFRNVNQKFSSQNKQNIT